MSVCRQYPKIGEFKKWKFSFFSTENNSMLTSFGKKLLSIYIESNKIFGKTIDMLLFSLKKKTEFHFFHYPIFGYCRVYPSFQEIASFLVAETNAVSYAETLGHACFMPDIHFRSGSKACQDLCRVCVCVCECVNVCVYVYVYWLYMCHVCVRGCD